MTESGGRVVLTTPQKFIIKLMQEVGEIATNTRLGEFIYIAQEIGLINPKLYDDFSFNYGTGIIPISFTLLKDLDELKMKGAIISGSVKIQKDYRSQSITLKEWNESILRALDLLDKTETQLAHFCSYLHYLKPRQTQFSNEKDFERFAGRSFLITRDCLTQIENYIQRFS